MSDAGKEENAQDGEGSSQQRATVRSRFLTEEERIWEHNAWDNYGWTPELEAEAEAKLALNAEYLDEEKRNEYEGNAANYWHKFYQKHGNHFFKDRHYLHLEFEELLDTKQDSFNLLEMGCGAGNTVFPLLKLNPKAFVYAFDFAEEAVNVVKANAEYDPERCLAFRYDPTTEEFPEFVKESSIDITTMIYLLSAIPPHKMDEVLTKLNRVMKPGAVILFRDYAKYDLTQLRFKKGHRLGENQYVRGDGTLVYFFTQGTS
eukprot:TRINITY_DN11957_c0_g1_i1.p1 TRINITY_DN11957_c0_g1~~TRINITY_DN11957_c0_g1_i1.p1  ORF type:complete len:260 (-),score=65.31 TRINITY_DN11957_c0_g1_i1:124-903(-)